MLGCRRTLGMENLEERHLLSATGMEDPCANAVVVTTLEDVVDPDDGYISLREAVSMANEDVSISRIIFSDMLPQNDVINLTLRGDLQTNHVVMVDASNIGDVTLNIACHDQHFLNLDFVNVMVENQRDTVIENCTFTGFFYSGFESLIENFGTLEVLQSDFTEIRVEECVEPYCSDAASFAILKNMGELTLEGVEITDNEFHTRSNRQDNEITVYGVWNAGKCAKYYASQTDTTLCGGETPTLEMQDVLLADNVVTARSYYGDTTARFFGIANEYAEAKLTDTFIHGNQATATLGSFPECVASSEMAGILSSYADVELRNCTVLDTLKLERGVATLYNTLYAELATHRGTILGENNLALESASAPTLDQIFAYYQNGTFINPATGLKDYHLQNNPAVVDAGNNAWVEEDNLWDVLAQNRIQNNRVDIGAVEYAGSTSEQLAMPRNASAVGTGTTTISVTWESVENASGYRVEWLQGNDWVTTGVSVSGTSANISGLSPDTTYDIRVIAVGEGNYRDSEPAYTSAKTWIQLEAPTWVSETTLNAANGNVTPHSITVNWVDYVNPLEAVGSYRVQYSQDQNTWYEATVSGNQATATGLTPSTTYHFRVMAVGIPGISASSGWNPNILTVSTSADPTPATKLPRPRFTNAVPQSSTEVKLQWTPIANAGNYTITYWTPTTEPQTITGVPSTTYTVPNLDPATTYTFTVTAISTSPLYIDSDPSCQIIVRTRAGV
ncbi:MAG: fibronectin type III domain-containing protein [Planctomycetia bacterium]|nr:fibronectin type III domain-containing protein [Planctomycetia bacterium]